MADEKPGGAGTPQPAGTTTDTGKTAEQLAAEKVTTDAAAAAASAGKTPETLAADAKTATDAKTAADVEAKRIADAAPKAPETYTLAIPEGAKGLIDETDLKAFEAQARAKGLSNDQAQAILAEQADALATQSAAFRTTTEADPIYGGAKLPETQRLAALALDKLRPAGTPHGAAFRSMLVKTGYGNHLEVVSLLADLGKLMAEDTHVASGGGGAPTRDAATVLYDKT